MYLHEPYTTLFLCQHYWSIFLHIYIHLKLYMFPNLFCNSTLNELFLCSFDYWLNSRTYKHHHHYCHCRTCDNLNDMKHPMCIHTSYDIFKTRICRCFKSSLRYKKMLILLSSVTFKTSHNLNICIYKRSLSHLHLLLYRLNHDLCLPKM